MIPDAPYIREAETFGMPDNGEEPKCPVCGSETDSYYVLQGEVLGCPNCIDIEDAYDWREYHEC